MLRKIAGYPLLLCVSILLSGCDKTEFSFFGSGISVSGGNQILSRDFEQFDDARFAKLLDPAERHRNRETLIRVSYGLDNGQLYRSRQTALENARKEREDAEKALEQARQQASKNALNAEILEQERMIALLAERKEKSGTPISSSADVLGGSPSPSVPGDGTVRASGATRFDEASEASRKSRETLGRLRDATGERIENTDLPKYLEGAEALLQSKKDVLEKARQRLADSRNGPRPEEPDAAASLVVAQNKLLEDFRVAQSEFLYAEKVAILAREAVAAHEAFKESIGRLSTPGDGRLPPQTVTDDVATFGERLGQARSVLLQAEIAAVQNAEAAAIRETYLAAKMKLEEATTRLEAARGDFREIRNKIDSEVNGSATSGQGASGGDGAANGSAKEGTNVDPVDIDAALRIANTYANPMLHRNSIQDTLIAASQQRCNYYLGYLKRLDSVANFSFGALTTALGGASAIVTGAGIARALGGSAGILSGVRAEFNEDFFHNLTINVLSTGIQVRREERLALIRLRQKRDIEEYNVATAVYDALFYHQQCTLIAGLQEAAESIEIARREPGLEQSIRTVRRIRVLTRETQALSDRSANGGGLLNGFGLDTATTGADSPLVSFYRTQADITAGHGDLDRSIETLRSFEAISGVKDRLDAQKAVADKANEDAKKELVGHKPAAEKAESELREAEAGQAVLGGKDSLTAVTAELDLKRLEAGAVLLEMKGVLRGFEEKRNDIRAELSAIEKSIRDSVYEKALALDDGKRTKLLRSMSSLGIAEDEEAGVFKLKIESHIRSASLTALKTLYTKIVEAEKA